DYRYKKDELFKRLKVTTFAQLVVQVASLSDETLEVTNEELHKLEGGDSAAPDAELKAGTNGKGDSDESPSPILFINNVGAGESHRSTLQSSLDNLFQNVTKCFWQNSFSLEGSWHSSTTPWNKDDGIPSDVNPFLRVFLSVETSSYSYPIATLSRTMNPYTNNILEYKNAHGKIIILYDNDERLASQAATTMCERGFENLFMLSGGLKVLAQKIPEGLVTGSLPESCQVPPPSGSARKRSSPRVPPAQAENKWRFSADDLQKIKYYLEEEHIPSDPSSRLSRGSSSHDSKVTSMKRSSSSSNPGSLTTRSLRTNAQHRPWK
ncbi:Centrosomal protein of 41 kDa, partial [Calypte anna]